MIILLFVDNHLIVILVAQGETSVVKAWHLRPSLIWKDGEWFEFYNVQNDSSSHEVLPVMNWYLIFVLVSETFYS